MKHKALLMMSLLLSPLSFANTDIMVNNPYARATPPAAVTSAVFAEIANTSGTDRYIVAAETTAAGKVELHDVIMDGDMMKMRQIPELKIPANGTLELKPGSFHIMLFKLPEPLAEGEKIDVEITFKNGEKQTFTAPVKKVMNGMQQH